MTCDAARLLLLDARRGRLAPPGEAELARHVEDCADCRSARAAEDALSAALARLPPHPAPPALTRRLAALAAAAAREPGGPHAAPVSPPRRWGRVAVPALAAGLLAGALLSPAVRDALRIAPPGALADLTSEAVADHLAVLRRERPVEIESAGRHDVKPWFEGKLDFAPAVPAPVAPEMRLVGGAVGAFRGRPAALVVYGLRKHALTLVVFRADGIAWPGAPGDADARTPLRGTLRGFHAFLWRAGGLGYALVGDVDPGELAGVAARLAEQT